MIDEIKQETEQELEEVKVGQEDKTAEGYEVLTDDDLNPDYEPTEEAEVTEESNEAQPKVDAKEDNSTQEDSPTEVEDQSYNINGASYKPSDIDKMAKDYTNLTQFMGKQAEELGKYKERANNLEAQDANSDIETSEPEAPVEVPDKDYDIYSKEGIAELANDMAEKKVSEYQSKQKEEDANARYISDCATAQEGFIKDHPEYKTEDDVVALIQDGAKAGIAAGDTSSPEALRKYLELAHAAVKEDFSYFNSGTRAKKSGGKVSKDSNKTIEKVMEANKVDSSLSDVNSDGTGGADYDKMGFDEWEKLPDDKRYELLGITKDSY